MARRVYYGICREATNGQYKVTVSDTDLLDESFQFEAGDLLSVYFLQANNDDAPSLVIQVGDTNQETSVSGDEGKLIKTRSMNFESAGMWDAGETVCFCYTKNYNADNVYYWEIVDVGRATQNIYGVTKLEGSSTDQIGEWIVREDEDDWTTALAPGMLKKLYKALVGGEDRDQSEDVDPDAPDQIAPLIGLTWTSAVEGDKVALGTLALNSNTGVTIDYPLEQKVIEIISAQPKDVIDLPDRTSDLINDGPDLEKQNNTEDGTYYITNILPNNTNLYYKEAGGSNYNFITPNSDGNHTVVINNSLSVPGGIAGNTLTAAGAITGGSITVTGTVQGAALNSTGNITGGTITARNNLVSNGAIKEQGGWLRDKYSGSLWVRMVSYTNISIGKNSHIAHYKINLGYGGWTPIGIVGYNMDYANSKSTGDATWCSVWECHFTSASQLEFGIRNHKNHAVKVNMYIYVLYARNN